MLIRTCCLLALIAMTAGCATDPAAQQKFALEQMEYKLKVYGPACEKLGFTKDTDEWRSCIQREYEQVLLRRQSIRSNDYWGPYYRPPYWRYR